jgi:hypothetical protein
LRTLGELKDSLAGLLQGTNLDHITGLNEAIERAARTLAQQVDIPEASGRQAVTLYDGVFDYSAPTTIFGGSLVDFRPQGNSRNQLDYVYKKPVLQFDRTKHYVPNGYNLTFEWKKGVGIMRVASPKPSARTIIDTMNDKDDWTAGGSMGTIVEDETVFYDHKPSLRFTLTGASTGTLTRTLDNALDIDKYEDVCVGFLAIRTPSASDLTSIALRIGSSDSAYDEVSETEGFLGAWTAGDWLLVAFDFSGATSTGTPDWNAIDYVQVRIAHGATLTNFYVGGLWLALPSPHEMLFQSAAIFNEDGTLSNNITDDNTEIILSDAAYTLMEYESAIAIAEQMNRGQPTAVSNSYRSKLYDPNIGLYQLYRGDNPSEEVRSVGNWYDD